MNNLSFQTLESSVSLPHGITHETWFLTRRSILAHSPTILRREVYKLDDGSVVAFRDSGINLFDTSLYMDEAFVDFYKYEPEMEVILSDQGIADFDLVKTFRME